MIQHLRPSVVMLALFTALTGIAYPLAMTGLAQVLFWQKANGSLVVRDGRVVGSELVGQAFKGAMYFHGRPSAAGDGYDAEASSGSNLGPLSSKLLDRVKADVEAIRSRTGAVAVPADAVTASASGLDPHISPAYAELQVARVAAARAVLEDRIREMVTKATESPTLGLIGEPRVNVLLLNLALDAALAARS